MFEQCTEQHVIIKHCVSAGMVLVLDYAKNLKGGIYAHLVQLCITFEICVQQCVIIQGDDQTDK